VLHNLFPKNESLLVHAVRAYKKNGLQLPHLLGTLWNVLLDATGDPRAGEVVVVLDALDECAEDERIKLIGILCYFYDNAPKDDGHQRLKFLVTSRPYWNIKREFAKLTANIPTIRLAGEEEPS